MGTTGIRALLASAYDSDVADRLPAGFTSGRTVLFAFVGLVIFLALPGLRLQRLFVASAVGARIGREIVWAGIGALVLIWTVRIERLPLSSIGFRPPGRDTWLWGVATTLVLLASVIFTFAVIAPATGLSQNMTATADLVRVPLWLLFLTPIVAGITEELIYRGYAIERLTLLTGRRWLAAVLAGSVFLLSHWAWGALQMIVVAIGTIILVGLYLWRRDLLCCIIAHVATDLVGLGLARLQT